MTDKSPNLDSLFLAALDMESAEERAAFLDSSCGADSELREQVERLLKSHEQAGSFLEQPPPEYEATILFDSSDHDRAGALEAGLAATFPEDQAVVIGHAGHSVLKSLRQTMNPPRVVLRDSEEQPDDPIVRPKSAEMPDRGSDSRYQLQGEIARGGMGAILKGRDTDLGRDLAIKVLLDAHKDKPEVVHRFIEEAQIGGQLQHPGIAPVYELGQFADQRPFFSMKLVKGETLSKLLADRKVAAEERGKFLGIFQQICQTMAYAHNRGVIHRDLKPANIMVGAFGEVQVMDWGLAKVLSAGGVADEKKSLSQDQSLIQTLRSKVGSDVSGTIGSVGSQTQMGSVMGTPAYMPPEQALGEIDLLDERADVFGLGAILCEILTGKPPYVADDGTLVFRLASRGKLGDCFERLDQCGADANLIALAKECLELEPQARPRNAGVLAERITGYLESVETKLRESELAKVDAQVRSEELRRRQKLAFAAGTAIVASLVIGIAASLWQAVRADSEAKRADLAAKQAESQEQLATAALEELRATAPAFAEQARALAAKEQFGEAIEKLDYALKLRPDTTDYLVAKGDLLQCQFKLTEAAAIYREALRVEPGLARAEASAALCDELRAAKPNEDGALNRESLAKLHLAMQRQQRPTAELMPVARLLGQEKTLLIDYWLERLKALPVSVEKPLKDRLSVREDGRLALDLSDTKITDLSPLAGAPLAALNLSSTQAKSDLADLTPLRGLDLVELNISNTSVTNLSPLREMRTLESLVLDYGKVTNLSELSGLQLKTLNFAGCAVSDLMPIREMPLEELNLRGTRVTDLSPLIGMPIKSIDLSLTPVTDFSPLAKLPLEKCYLQRNRIKDLTVLRGLPLNELVLWGCIDARHYAVLGEIKTLELLLLPSSYRELPAEDYTAIGALRSLPKLRQLGAEVMDGMNYAATGSKDSFWQDWDREQTFLPALRKSGLTYTLAKLPTGFYWLYFRNQPSLDLSILQGAPISQLDVRECQITDLAPLRDLPLEFLNCAFNPITDLGPLSGKRISSLCITHTKVSDLSPLTTLPLKNLSLNGCANVTDVTVLAEIPTLEQVALPSHAAGIEALRKLPLLKRLGYGLIDQSGAPSIPDATAAEFWKYHDENSWITQLRDAGIAFNRLQRLDEGTWEVDLNNSRISDLTVLKGAPISSLSLLGTDVSDLRPIADLPLATLNIGLTKVTDLSFLRETKVGARLRYLDISRLKVTDFTPLAACTNLVTLRTYGNTAFSDLGVLKSKNLQDLWLAHTRVADLSPLAGMPLMHVYMDHCPEITDVSPLGQCPTLESVILPPRATNLKALRGLPNLKTITYTFRSNETAADFWKEYDANLWISRLREAGFHPNKLKQLPDGTWEVNLTSAAISDLSILKGAPISILELGNTAIADLEPLRGMALRQLFVYRTKVADLSPLKGMPLQELNAALTNVTDVSPLRGISLSRLTFSGCAGLTDVSPLADCKELQSLCLPPNAKDIEFLRGFPKLKRLSYTEDKKNSYRPDKTAAEFWKDYDAKK